MTLPEESKFTALKPALQGGTQLSPFVGTQSTKDGAKEDLKALDLLKVYKHLYPHKNVGATKSSGETLVSCFNDSGHSNGDQNPSMALNNSINTYHCFGCETSGDILDLIANKQGYATGSGKCPHDQIHQAVFDANQVLNLGWEFHQASDGKYYRGPASGGAGAATVVQLPAGINLDDAEELESNIIPIQPPVQEELEPLDWRNLIENDCAMRVYMELVTQDDIAEEYHFWNFMVLLGLLIGKDVALDDPHEVYGNLFVCLNGETSAGKSRSMSYVKRLAAHDSLRFDPADPYSDGIKTITSPPSGESLTRSFQHESEDPAANIAPVIPGGKQTRQVKPKIVHPVRGMVQIEELTTMVSKADIRSSTLKTTMIELYDCNPVVGGSPVQNGSNEARDAFASILSSVQPKVLGTLFSGTNDASSGFLNRWIFVAGNHKPRHPRGSRVDIDPVVPWLEEIKTWAQDIKTSQGGVIYFARSSEADRFDKFCRDVIFGHDQTIGLERIHLLYKKFVLLGCALYREDNVSDRALDLAEYLVNWIIKGNRYQGIDQLEDKVLDRFKTSAAKIIAESGKNGISPSMLKRKIKGVMGAGTYDEDTVTKAIGYLKYDGEISLFQAHTGKRGRPSKRYVDNLYYDHWKGSTQE